MFTRYIVKETKTANVNVEKKVDFLLINTASFNHLVKTYYRV